MPIKAVQTAKFAVLDAGGLKPAKAAPRSAPAAAAVPAAAAAPPLSPARRDGRTDVPVDDTVYVRPDMAVA